VLVYSSDTGKYEPFSNIKGWIFGDQSMLRVQLSLHVYSEVAYKTATNKFTRCTSVEQAMHHEGKVYGDETPAAHKKPKVSLLAKERMLKETSPAQGPHRKKQSLTRLGGKEAEEMLDAPDKDVKKGDVKKGDVKKGDVKNGDKSKDENSAASTKAGKKFDVDEHPVDPLTTGPSPWISGSSCWQFMKTGPWYNTHTEGLEELIKAGKATRVPVLQKVYMESYQRYATMPVPLDAIKGKEFSQVGLHFRLTKPDGQEFDHWDRVGSVGLEFTKSSGTAHLHEKSENKPVPTDPSMVDADYYDGAHSLTAISGLLVALFAYNA